MLRPGTSTNCRIKASTAKQGLFAPQDGKRRGRTSSKWSDSATADEHWSRWGTMGCGRSAQRTLPVLPSARY